MTEFSNVTTSATVIGGATLDLAADKLYINLAGGDWSKANAMATEHLATTDPKNFYKTESRKFLWKMYFSSTQKIASANFWEDVLANLAQWDDLDIHKQTKTVIRATLMQVISIYIDCGCVLLPLCSARKDTPTWHSERKPLVTGEPYRSIFEHFLDSDAVVSSDSKRKTQGRFNLLFSSVRINDESDCTIEVNDTLYNSSFSEFLRGNGYAQILQAVNQLAVFRGKASSFQVLPGSYIRGSLAVKARSSGILDFVENESIPEYDHLETMRRYLTRRFATVKTEHPESWLNAIEMWITESTVREIGSLYQDMSKLLAWMNSSGINNLRPQEMERHMFVRSTENTIVSQTFVEMLTASDESTHKKSRIMRHTVDFFVFHFDVMSDEAGFVVPSPIIDTDKKAL